MKIGQFSDSFLPVTDATGRVVLDFTNALCEQGHECYVIAPMGYEGFRGGLPFEIVDYACRRRRISGGYGAGLLVTDAHYRRRVDRLNLDILHAHSPFFAGQEALRLAAKLDRPLVGTFHSGLQGALIENSDKRLAELGARFVAEFYSQCDEVWVAGDKAASLLESYGYKGEVVLMPNGTSFSDKADIAGARRLCGENGGLPMLLYVGKLELKKGVGRLLEAASMLKRSGQRFCLVLAGQGRDAQALLRLTKALELEEQVRFTGHVHDDGLLAGLYTLASLLIIPSCAEQPALVLQEAAVLGTPAVVMEGSAHAGEVTDGINGFVAKNSTAGLYRTLCYALADERALQRIGQRAKADLPRAWTPIALQAINRYARLVQAYGESTAWA